MAAHPIRTVWADLRSRERSGAGTSIVGLSSAASSDGMWPVPADPVQRVCVGTARFELAAPGSQSRCATRLRHVPWAATLPARSGGTR